MSHTTLAASSTSHSTPLPQLHGWTLGIARAMWGAVAVLSLVVAIASIGATYHLWSTAATPLSPSGWTARDLSSALAAFGLSASFLSVYILLHQVVLVTVYFAVAVLLLWRKSGEWMALCTSLFLLVFPANWVAVTDALPGAWYLLDQGLAFLAYSSFLFFFFLFPDGKFVPSWPKRIGISVPAGVLLVQQVLPRVSWAAKWLGLPLLLIALTCAGSAQIYRYRNASSPVQRQQIKWLAVGFMAAVLVLTSYELLAVFFPWLRRPSAAGLTYEFLEYTLGIAMLLLIPLAIAIAILRHRLWDIDRLTNRALVYGTLTGLLAALYLGIVVCLQTLTGTVNSDASRSPVIIVITTLLIAALFNPLRRGIQATIDQRFYRRKYDSARTLAAFSQTLRSEVDLEQLSAQLLAVVQETMQPESVSLWLRPPEWHLERPTHHLEPSGSSIASGQFER